MSAFLTMLTMVLMFALLAVPGFLLGRRGLIERAGMLTLSNILIYIAMPFLVLSELLKTDLRALSPVGIACSALLPAALVLLLSKTVSAVLRGGSDVRVTAFCASFSNCGFLGIPLAAAVFPDVPAVAVYVSIFNVSNSFLIWTYGAYLLTRDRHSVSLKRALLNPVTFAVIFGVALSLLGANERVPQLGDYAGMLAALTTPLSMTVLGFELSQSELKRIFLDRRTYVVSLFRLVLAPAVAVGVMLLLRAAGLDDGAVAPAMFLAAAVPTATTATAMAEKYGADAGVSARLTLGSTLLSLLTIPLLYLAFGLLF